MLAGCAVTQPVAAEARPAAGHGDRRAERAARALVDGVRRPGAERAGRRGARQQPRPQVALARIEAARSQVLLAQSYLVPERQPAGNAEPLAHLRRDVAAAAARHAADQQRLRRCRCRCPTSSTSGASTAAACSRRPTTSTRRATTARRCASAWPPTSRARISGCARPTPSSRCCRTRCKLRTETVQLQRDRFEGGIIGEYDLRSAEAERSAVVADIARAQKAIGLLESRDRHADRPLAARGVHAGSRARRVDRRRHRGAVAAGRACRRACIERRPDIRRTRSAARGVRPAHPGSARQLLPVA